LFFLALTSAVPAPAAPDPVNAESATSDWGDNGFVLKTPDGKYQLGLRGTIQVQLAYNRRQGDVDVPERWGFEVRRATLRISGHVVDPTWRYLLHGNFAGSEFRLLDASVTKLLGDTWSLRLGQFKLPFLREELIGYNNLLAVDRSLISSTFGVGRSEGVDVIFDSERFRWSAALNNGLGPLGEAPEDFVGGLIADNLTKFAATARLEVMLGSGGSWEQFNDYADWPEYEKGVVVGLGVHWQRNHPDSTDERSQIGRWTVDATMEYQPVNLYVSVVGNHAKDAGELDQFGVVVQGGVLVGAWEPLARYEWADADGVGSDLSLITVGAAYFAHRGRLKWTTDLGYSFEPVTELFANEAKTWFVDAREEDGQLVVRSQLMLAF
jgi:hypothetical protein